MVYWRNEIVEYIIDKQEDNVVTDPRIAMVWSWVTLLIFEAPSDGVAPREFMMPYCFQDFRAQFVSKIKKWARKSYKQ